MALPDGMAGPLPPGPRRKVHDGGVAMSARRIGKPPAIMPDAGGDEGQADGGRAGRFHATVVACGRGNRVPGSGRISGVSCRNCAEVGGHDGCWSARLNPSICRCVPSHQQCFSFPEMAHACIEPGDEGFRVRQRGRSPPSLRHAGLGRRLRALCACRSGGVARHRRSRAAGMVGNPLRARRRLSQGRRTHLPRLSRSRRGYARCALGILAVFPAVRARGIRPRHGMACSRRAADRAPGRELRRSRVPALAAGAARHRRRQFRSGLQRGTQGDHDRRALCRPRPAGHRAHAAGMRSHEVGADRPGGDIRRRSHALGSVRRIVAGRDRAHLLHRHRLLP